MNEFNDNCIAKDLQYYNQIGFRITQDSDKFIEEKAHA